jgi:DNA-binding NtrC family response regulator
MATLTFSDELDAHAPDARIDLKARLLAYERDLITAALTDTGGNQRRAARRLGILPTTLHEKMKRLGLRANAFQPASARAEAEPDAGAPGDAATTRDETKG